MHTANAFDSRNWTLNSAAAATAAAKSAAAATSGTDFAAFLDSLKGADTTAGSSVSSLLERLSRRFPGVNFTEGAVGDTAEDVQEAFGDEEGDNVAITPEAAEAVAGNAGLASMLESVLAAFRDSMGATQPAEGAHVQRNVMVASATIRFSVSQIDSRTGETLSMSELTSAFSGFAEQLQELAQKFFGESGGTGESADAGTAGGNAGSNFFAGGMSFSMYFSAGMFSSQGTGGTGSREGSGGNSGFSLEDFMNSFRQGGNFQNYLGGIFGGGANAIGSLLDGGLDMFGLSRTGMTRESAGFSFRFGMQRSGSTLLAELMEMLNARNAAAAPAPVETPDTPETQDEPGETVEIPAEAAAVA